MAKKESEGKNLRLAATFIYFVLGLVIMSFLVKIIFTIKDSHFDGNHKFNVVFKGTEDLKIVSFSPSNNSFSVLNIYQKIEADDVAKNLSIPIDGIILSKEKLDNKNISSIIFNTLLPFGNSYKNMTVVDLLRIFLFSRSVSVNSIYTRDLLTDFNNAQKSTVINLTFTDPSIYQENQSIEIINATNVFGLGGRLAGVISNMGGNVILVSGASENNKSEIVYYKSTTYTVRKLSGLLGFPLRESDKKGIADVIIIIGKDSLGKTNF